jgi:hypothetical protein
MDAAKQYRAKSGRLQFKPSDRALVEIVESDNNQGFCLSCGEWVEYVEPDTRQGTCPHCRDEKVYGAEELLTMGLFYDADREADKQRGRA